jgi:hypothetical protein
MNEPDGESFLNAIDLGNRVEGVIVFGVPEGMTPSAIEVRESMFSGGTLVSLGG